MDLRKGKKSLKAWIMLAVVLLVGFIIGFVFTADIRAGIKKGDYQLVTLTTGERYIGKLTGVKEKYVTLTNVYYQQNTGADTADKEGGAADITVAKLSSSVAKPENTLHIASDKIAHWANLQSDSKIVQAIEKDGTSE